MSDVIIWPSRIDGAALKALSTDLTKACGNKSIQIDAGDVTHMGALAGQLILAASRDVHKNEGTLEFVSLSERAADQLTTMGMAPDMLSEGAI